MHKDTKFALSDMPVPTVFAAYRIIRDCNEEFAGLFGYQRHELLDASFSRLYPAIADFVRTGETASPPPRGRGLS